MQSIGVSNQGKPSFQQSGRDLIQGGDGTDNLFFFGSIARSDNIDGTGDFARITDFKVGEDLIQLSGLRDSYELKPITNSLQGGRPTPDMGVFKRGGFLQPLESIAIIQDAPTGLNINDAAQFKFS